MHPISKEMLLPHRSTPIVLNQDGKSQLLSLIKSPTFSTFFPHPAIYNLYYARHPDSE